MDVLIATFISSKNPRHFRSILRERKLARYQKPSVSVALSRLRKKGYLKKGTVGWSITKKGEERNMRKELRRHLSSPFPKSSPKNTVIAFDIPVTKSGLRDWLRWQLKIFNYEMLQQSLWFGPGPLPQEFLRRLEDLNIRENIKIFSVKKLR